MFIARVAQLVERLSCKQQVVGSTPAPGSVMPVPAGLFVGVAQLVERNLAMVDVVGSIPITRSGGLQQ